MEPSIRPPVCFSSDGSLLAVSGSGGDVCVWESQSGKQLCRPACANWSSVFCLAWAPLKIQCGRRRRKRTSSTVDKTSSLLAVGGNHGLSIWDVRRNEEQYAMPKEGFDAIISTTWGHEETLFIADGSPQIAQWNSGNNAIEKWKADKRGVSCVCMNSDGNVLVTAGRTIKLWNISDHSLLTRFSGHVSNIQNLQFISSNILLSTAQDDRTMCLWNMESGDSISLVCENSISYVTSSAHEQEEKELKLVAICEDGIIHMFTTLSNTLNNHMEPVLPISTVQFRSQSSSEALPILSGHMTSSGDVLLAHSSYIRPVFETICFHQDNKRVCLERIVPNGLILSKEEKHSLTDNIKKEPVAIMSGNPPLSLWRTGKGVQEMEDIPMTDRLQSLSINEKLIKSEEKEVFQRPTAESLSILVVQSVHSGDKSMLEQVLSECKDRVVNSTVRNLPLTTVVPFLKTLVDLLQTRPSRGPELSVWIRAILLSHTAYLLTVPHLLNTLSTLYQSMDSRTVMFHKLNRLQGKLDLLLAQTSEDNGDNGMSNQLQFLTTPLLSVAAGGDNLFNDEEEAELFQSSDDEEEEEEEEQEENGSFDEDDDMDI